MFYVYTHWDLAMEVLTIITPSVLLAFITTNLESACQIRNNIKATILFEFLSLSTPFILTTTILSENIDIINIILIAISILLLIVNKSAVEPPMEGISKDQKKDIKKLDIITNARSTVNFISVLCILAIDFTMFPRHFGKTEQHGFSLMDVGVGLYVVSNGIVAPEIRGIKDSIFKTIINVIPILVIGICRFLMVTITHYNVHITEYGKHWNFFITLASTKLISAVIMSSINCNFFTCGLCGMLIIVVHQLMLTMGLENWVFSDAGRENFVEANREGIVSSIGYVGLYILSVSFGFLLQLKFKKFYIFATSIVIFGCLTIISHDLFNISRCLANSTYCFWIMFILALMTGLYYCLELFLKCYYRTNDVLTVPYVFEAINYNGLTFFLVANLLTGFVNLTWHTRGLSTLYALTILSIYMLLTTGITSLLLANKIRLKL